MARLNSVWILLSIVVSRSWPLYKECLPSWRSARESIHGSAPGYVVAGSEHLVWRLQKALYSLKQSPHAWFDKFSVVVLGYGF